jgi:hypothetical protein
MSRSIGGRSGELIERHVTAGWGSGFEQGFDAAHGFGCGESPGTRQGSAAHPPCESLRLRQLRPRELNWRSSRWRRPLAS